MLPQLLEAKPHSSHPSATSSHSNYIKIFFLASATLNSHIWPAAVEYAVHQPLVSVDVVSLVYDNFNHYEMYGESFPPTPQMVSALFWLLLLTTERLTCISPSMLQGEARLHPRSDTSKKSTWPPSIAKPFWPEAAKGAILWCQQEATKDDSSMSPWPMSEYTMVKMNFENNSQIAQVDNFFWAAFCAVDYSGPWRGIC